MQCPKCSAAMEESTYDDITYDRCRRCGGLWFDMLEHEKLRVTRGAEAIDTGDADTGRAQNAIGGIQCPRCKTLMIGMTAREQPDVKYEMCSTCGGKYLDAGEFRALKGRTLGDVLRWFCLGLAKD